MYFLSNLKAEGENHIFKCYLGYKSRAKLYFKDISAIPAPSVTERGRITGWHLVGAARKGKAWMLIRVEVF